MTTVFEQTELNELFNDMDVAKRINIQQCRWLGHAVRMDENAPTKRVFDAVVGDHRLVGRPRTCWKEQVKGTLRVRLV